jgi:hypothetical protein
MNILHFPHHSCKAVIVAKLITRLMIALIAVSIAFSGMLKCGAVARALPRNVAHLIYGTPMILPITIVFATVVALAARYNVDGRGD